MKEIEPRYTPCSRNYLSQSLIPSMFQKVKECIAKLVEKEQHISLTTDIWSSDSLDSYLSCTGPWIDSNWENKECCLHAQPFNERHTGENIVTVFTTCLDTWNITGKLHLVLRDSGSNFVAGFRNADILSCACFAHTLLKMGYCHKEVSRSCSPLLAKLLATSNILMYRYMHCHLFNLS